MSDHLQTLWQSQKGARAPLSLAQLADAAPRFERIVRRRNTIEYVAGGLTMVIFAAYAVHFSDPMMKLGSVLSVVAAAFVTAQIYLRARAGVRDPAQNPGQSLAAFHRAELERQRKALGNVALWYLAPLVPGYLLFSFGAALVHTPPAWTPLWVNLALGGVTFGLIWWLNVRTARKLAERIEALDALMREAN